jgi:chemotaxis protein methyltransferase CheR
MADAGRDQIEALWFSRLTELVEQRYGLSAKAQRDRLHAYLDQRSETGRLLLADRLAGQPDTDPEWRRLVEALLVHETFFYRHADQLEVLAQQVLPALARRRKDKDAPLRVWCAGCATGEEAFTLAFLLRDAGHPATVIGTDASGTAIAHAREGAYRKTPGLNCFRAMPGGAWRHFVARRAEPDCWEVSPDIRRQVDFVVHNLMAPRPRDFSADIICCRNTMIYFSAAGVQRAEASLEAAARPGTVLLLGPTERLRHSTVFRTVDEGHPQILHWPIEETRR